MKRILALVCSIALMTMLFAGCGNNGNEQGSNNEGGEGAGIPVEDIKVGVIHIGDPATGSGYSYTHDQGIVAMQENLGLSDDQIVRKNNIDDTNTTAIENAMNECIEEGCNIIFATSWGYMDSCEALAAEYPNVFFSHATGYKSNDTNFNNYFGRIYQARYLSGIDRDQQDRLCQRHGQRKRRVHFWHQRFRHGRCSRQPRRSGRSQGH